MWSAAAWVGITRDSNGQWGDGANGALSGLPWCPNEPNNNVKDGADESCSNLLTGCSESGQALLNDFACDKVARVVCSFDTAECGEWPFEAQCLHGSSRLVKYHSYHIAFLFCLPATCLEFP